jgi:hypothetical protein
MKNDDLQEGRGVAKSAPKDFKKAEKGYKEVFGGKNKTKAQDKKWAPKYSRVTHKAISKASQGKPL